MTETIEIKVPDIGDYTDVPVIEVQVKAGESVDREQPLVTLESDKATVDVPSPHAGVVKQLKVKVGDKVSEGSVIMLLEPADTLASANAQTAAAAAPPAPPPEPAPPEEASLQQSVAADKAPSALAEAPAITPGTVQHDGDRRISHASPSVRKFARELGVEIEHVKGSGPKGRITHGDVQAYIKARLSGEQQQLDTPRPVGGGELDLLPWPQVDFAKFGPIDAQPLSRIKKISGANLHRNWVMIPHITHHEDADITELEALRLQLNNENRQSGIKVTLLAFLMKVCVAALKRYPNFNASLNGDQLVYKRYYHIGFAADTPNGLVVPVIRHADQKGVLEIAAETAELAKLARDGKLKTDQMQGGCFSISSLGGIGGRYFTPIIRAPEVSILGVCRSATQPVWDGQQFMPRLILPLSLSYDHRVIDGAEAARFSAYLAQLLADFRRVML